MQTDNFTVPFERDGVRQMVDVHIAPSTDDVDTYVCHLHGERITQIRKDSGQWKQLWGTLHEQDVKRIGAQIDQALTI